MAYLRESNKNNVKGIKNFISNKGKSRKKRKKHKQKNRKKRVNSSDNNGVKKRKKKEGLCKMTVRKVL